MEQYKEEFVMLLAKSNCIERGRILRSGRVSPIYFNFSGNLYTGKNIELLASYYAHALHGAFKVDEKTVLFGPAMKGIPLATETASAYARLYQQDLRFAFNRYKEKEHGEGGMVCGKLEHGDKLIFLDDAFTTGGTIKSLVERVKEEEQGIDIAGLLIGIDRKEMDGEGYNAAELFAHEQGIKICSVVIIDEVIEILEKNSLLAPEWKEEIITYRAQYGC